jgi:hypothetical protein
MAKATPTAVNSLIQATILKKCDRTGHNPESNKGCANGTCQHTCEPAQYGSRTSPRDLQLSSPVRWARGFSGHGTAVS